MSPTASVLPILALLLFLVYSAYGQGSGTISITQLPDFNAAQQDVQNCLWTQLAKDLGCSSSYINSCYCPTGDSQTVALEAITNCLIAYFHPTAISDAPTAVSVYSKYCLSADQGWLVFD